MNNWEVLIAVVLAIGLGVASFLGGHQVYGPMPLLAAGQLPQVLKAYQRELYPIEETGAVVENIPYPWMSTFAPGQVLKVSGRMLYNGHIVPYVSYRALSGKYQYPFLVQFDINGDGVFSDNESLIFRGNPSTTAPIDLSAYLQGARSKPQGAGNG